MSGRPGRRMQSGVSTGSQQDIRIKKRERDPPSFPSEDDRGGYGDARGRGEEVRISRLTRLLARLDTEESFNTICGQIETALNEGENQRYVSRCFQCLSPGFLEIFKGLSGLPWEGNASKRYAQLLSRICRAMDNVKFFQWLVDIIVRTSKGDVHISSSAYVMQAVSLQMINLIDPEDTTVFVQCVYDVLEEISNSRVFLVLGSIFVCGTNATANTWRNPNFQDFIDLVVGWMVDTRQSNGQFMGCAELLENSKDQFLRDLRFLVTLMSQILEDLEQAIKKVQPEAKATDSDEFLKPLQFMRALATLMSLECPLDKPVITEFCDRLVTSTLQFIRMCEPHQSMDRKYRYELLSTVNQTLFFSGGVLGQSITKYFRAQLKLGTTNSSYTRWPKMFLTSFLESITVWVEAAVSQTQLPEDITEICETLLNLIDDIKENLPPHDQHYVLSLVIALLRTRNVTLLQNVYAWLIGHLPQLREKQATRVEDDASCLFVLAGLTDIISNKGSSILSLWALSPPMFELLVGITEMNVHSRTQLCALELLKAHCSMHSHFVSSVASTGSFSADSPGSKFLPALMDFWLCKLVKLSEPQNKWLADWILEFLQSTNSYASLLYELKPEFFHQLIQIITTNQSLLMYGAKMLEWFLEDAGYIQLEALTSIIQQRVIHILLDEKLSEKTKTRYKLLIYQINKVLVIPDAIFTEDCMESSISSDQRDDTRKLAFTSTEFNLFLHELLLGNSTQLPKFSFASEVTCDKILSAAADHLIRLKLKTPLGKPQDFFAQLFLILRRSRASKVSVPSWKLHFLFELEKKFQLWIHGSALDESVITEHIKQYYIMNKLPFLECLKRIRSEIIDVCIFTKEYPLAYFNAALVGDFKKMEYILFRIADGVGLKGMGNLAGYYFLEGKYEEAVKILQAVEDASNGLQDEIIKNSTGMLQDSCAALQKWPDSKELKSHNLENIMCQLQNSSLNNLLDLQLCNRKKTDIIAVIGNAQIFDNLKLPSLHKLHILLKTATDFSNTRSEIRDLETVKMNKMLEAGNMEYVKKWLIEKEVNVNSIISDDDLSNLPLASIPIPTLKVCADFYAKKLEFRKSIILYNILTELVAGSMNSDLAHQITSNLSSRLMESDDFFAMFSAESLSHCDRLETIKSLHQVALQSFPECSKSWLEYGNFAYSILGKRKNVSPTDLQNMKTTAVECYVKYMQLSPPRTETSMVASHSSAHSKRVIVMTRLLQLFREGFSFDLEESITNHEWLILLAEMSQIPQIRSYLIEKFPEEVSLFLTSNDARKATTKLIPRRRNLFDLSPYAYVDTSEEPLSSTVLLSNLTQLEKLNEEGSPAQDSLENYQFRSDMDIPASVSVFGQELLRLASSMEDMWVWSLERIAVDWSRRMAYLRKECTRSLSTEKVQAYVKPIITYLEELLKSTHASDNPVDVNFLNRHKAEIQKQLSSMSAGCTAEDVTSAMHSLMKYSERFGILVNNRLPLQMFSTKLANPEFYESSAFSLCLPGQPSHLKICNVHPMVHALPTKTKPKRIKILATNGKFYDYLVKGTENLNIDCGVMQFLKVSQSFINQTTRTYSVTPLGKRGGLIQIVPDAVPLFTLYKKHLQRNQCMEKTSEMFWRRMNSLGYEDRSSLTALREVFESLSNETSSDLITRELLLSATTPFQWLDSVQTFTRDCSVGSAIGYLLGIGDRHLDNMLVNVTKGKFIHVDFTIIFGRGASLRVPEKVPFRLTQNLQSVLQYPGPMGAFSVVMQDVLSSFLEYRETATHLVKNIAFSHMYDEDSPVDLTKVLLSEVDAAVRLFLCRTSQYLSLIQAMRTDILGALDDTESSRKIVKKMNRWRRMLVNLNTVLQFVTSMAQPSCSYGEVTNIIHNQWKRIFQTSLETGVESMSSNSFMKALEETECILKELQQRLTGYATGWNSEMLKLHDSNIQVIDMNKVEILVKFAEMNIQTFDQTTTVKKLVEEATSIDYLSQMYEGWTPWV